MQERRKVRGRNRPKGTRGGPQASRGLLRPEKEEPLPAHDPGLAHHWRRSLTRRGSLRRLRTSPPRTNTPVPLDPWAGHGCLVSGPTAGTDRRLTGGRRRRRRRSRSPRPPLRAPVRTPPPTPDRRWHPPSTRSSRGQKVTRREVADTQSRGVTPSPTPLRGAPPAHGPTPRRPTRTRTRSEALSPRRGSSPRRGRYSPNPTHTDPGGRRQAGAGGVSPTALYEPPP